MTRNKTIAQALDRLFRTYPQSDRGSPEEVARDRIERAQVYFEAVQTYETCDIEAAVSALLAGTAPGVNPNFAPPAPVVAAEVRRQMNLRLDHERLERFTRYIPPPAPTPHSPESVARVQAMTAELVERLRSVSADDDERRYRDRLSRTNAAFDRERGYSVGDPDGDAA